MNWEHLAEPLSYFLKSLLCIFRSVGNDHSLHCGSSCSQISTDGTCSVCNLRTHLETLEAIRVNEEAFCASQ